MCLRFPAYWVELANINCMTAPAYKKPSRHKKTGKGVTIPFPIVDILIVVLAITLEMSRLVH